MSSACISTLNLIFIVVVH